MRHVLATTLLAVCFAGRLFAGEIKTDIEYGRVGDVSLKLDASAPDGAGPFPIAIIVHGGGWHGGDKKDMRPLFGPLNDAHFAWVSINYRLTPANRWPACLEDLQAAIRWTKAHAAELKGDPNRIVLIGHSAGGHLVAMGGLMATPETRVRAVVAMSPVTDFEFGTEKWGGFSANAMNLFGVPNKITDETRIITRKGSPLYNIKQGICPFLLVHGTADTNVGYQQTVNFFEKMKQAGNACEMISVKDGTHAFGMWDQVDPSWKPKFLAWLASGVLVAEASSAKTLMVAPDGSGDFKTVQAAIDSAPKGSAQRVVIHIKPGTYKEKIVVPKDKPMITLLGDDAATTILTNDWNSHHTAENGREVGTFGTFSTTIEAPDFLAENITFENTAGDTGQAVALGATGDRQVYRNCRMLGWQDTLYTNGGRQFYDHCYIAGRVDFIFGNSTAVFDHCEIHSRNGGHVTAASTAQDHPWGYVFLDCKLTGEGAKADLGRPWRPYAAVVYVRCEIGDHIKPAGWSIWVGNENHKTARYFEYQCTGPGADRSKRLDWTKELPEKQAKELTVENLLLGQDHWDPKAVK